MLRGLFNTIIVFNNVRRLINAGRSIISALFGLAGAFNGVAGKRPAHTAQGATEAVHIEGETHTLRRRFNGTANDNLSFSGHNEAKAARVHALMNLLREVAQRIAEGTAVLSDAMGIIAELEMLGIKIHGLPLFFHGGAMGTHTKTVRPHAPRLMAA